MASIPTYSSGGTAASSPNPLPSEFAGLGLAPGVVRGARSFKVDSLGRLTGVVHEKVWRPGENVSECLKDDVAGVMWVTINAINQMQFSYQRAVSSMPSWAVIGDDEDEAIIPLRPTIAPVTGRRKKKGGNVVMVPDKGSHAPKAVKPPPASLPTPPAPLKPHTMVDCACGFYGYYDGSDDYYKDGMVSGVIEGYGEALIGTRGFRVARARIVALMIPAAQDRFANRIARNYAGIPIFERFADMVRAFPPDGSEVGISPENGDDFWIRKA